MKEWPLVSDTPPGAAGDWLAGAGDGPAWTLGDVLEWMAGKPCSYHRPDAAQYYRSVDLPCASPGCWTDPPAEYARDVLCAFIMAGGATHPNHVEWAEIAKGIWLREDEQQWILHFPGGLFIPYTRSYFPNGAEPRLMMKRRILRLFSGPVEKGGVRISCLDCGGIGTCPRESTWTACMRCKQHGEITPEQLLPPEQAPITVPTEPEWDEIADYD